MPAPGRQLMLVLATAGCLLGAADTSVRDRVVAGALNLARQNLACAEGRARAGTLLDFAVLMAPDNEQAHALKAAADAGVAIAPPDDPTAAAAYADFLAQVASRDRNARRRLLCAAIAHDLDATNAVASQLLEAGRRQGWDVTPAALIAGKKPASAAPAAEFRLSERIDFLTPLTTMAKQIFAANLAGAKTITDDNIMAVGRVAAARAKAAEADAEAAGIARECCVALLEANERRRELVGKYQEAKSWTPPLARDLDSDKVKAEIAATRARRQANVIAEWERCLADSKPDFDRLCEDLAAECRELDKAAQKHLATLSREQRDKLLANERARKQEQAREQAALQREREESAAAVAAGPLEVEAVAPGELYDPTPGKTPTVLMGPLKEVGLWLEVQADRAGGSVARRVFAKVNGGRAILYVQGSDDLLSQSRDLRLRMVEGMQRYWAQRCVTNKRIKSLDLAHLVLLDGQSQIVGGSRETNGTDVWVK